MEERFLLCVRGRLKWIFLGFGRKKSRSKDTEILDYGCGTGLTIKKVVEFNPRKITGIDISEVSIEKAKKETQNLKEKVNLSVDNCERTKFADNKFDIIYGLGILHHLEFSKCII